MTDNLRMPTWLSLAGSHSQYLLAGVSDQQVMRVEQLHLPHPQPAEAVEVEEEAAQLVRGALLLADPHGPVVEEH